GSHRFHVKTILVLVHVDQWIASRQTPRQKSHAGEWPGEGNETLKRGIEIRMQRVYVLKSVRLSHASILLSAANLPAKPRRAMELDVRKQCAEGLNRRRSLPSEDGWRRTAQESNWRH